MRRVIKVMLNDAKNVAVGFATTMGAAIALVSVLAAFTVPFLYFTGMPITPTGWVVASIGWVLIVVGGVGFGVVWYSNAEERAERQLAREERRERRKQARRKN